MVFGDVGWGDVGVVWGIVTLQWGGVGNVEWDPVW